VRPGQHVAAFSLFFDHHAFSKRPRSFVERRDPDVAVAYVKEVANHTTTA
jgi:hypothetical protein